MVEAWQQVEGSVDEKCTVKVSSDRSPGRMKEGGKSESEKETRVGHEGSFRRVGKDRERARLQACQR